MIETNGTIDSILLSHRDSMGDDYDKYRNHVYRVFNLTIALANPEKENFDTLAIAAAFHDIGIWTANTFDYLAPSITLARNYLHDSGLTQLERSVTEIIYNHHKLSTCKSNNIAEAFRKADLIDLSFGLINFGVKANYLRQLNAAFPSLDFHRFILAQALKNTARHPFNPLPMMRL